MKIFSIFTVIFISLYSGVLFASMGNDVKLSADSVAKDSTKNISTLIGNAQIKQGDHTLKANKIVVNPETGLIIASGGSSYEDGKTTLKEYELIFRIENGRWTLIKQTR